MAISEQTETDMTEFAKKLRAAGMDSGKVAAKLRAAVEKHVTYPADVGRHLHEAGFTKGEVAHGLKKAGYPPLSILDGLFFVAGPEEIPRLVKQVGFDAESFVREANKPDKLAPPLDSHSEPSHPAAIAQYLRKAGFTAQEAVSGMVHNGFSFQETARSLEGHYKTAEIGRALRPFIERRPGMERR